MIDFGPSNLIVWTLSVTVLFFALDLWRRIAEAARVHGERGRRAAAVAGAVIGTWLALALLATFVPAIGGSIVSIPGLQPALLAGIVSALTWAAFTPAFRRAFDGVPWESVLSFFYWRAVFGALLLAAYAAGRLPAGFGVPAGLGDLAVTLLAVALLAFKDHSGDPPRGALLAWSALGLLDLVVVLFLGITVLRPWIAARGLAGPNFGLLLFAVPLFMALHICIFGRLWRERRSAPAIATAAR
jgi:hypothetical protein